jgi:hypothetical protein
MNFRREVVYFKKGNYMKKLLLSIQILFFVCVVACIPTLKADSDYSYVSDSNEYESLLDCGSFNIVVHAGVAPTNWRNRGDFSAVSCFASSIPDFNQSIIPLVTFPKFNKFFRSPWIVGGQIGYAFSDRSELYVEVNYRQASRKDFAINNITIPNDVVNVAFQFGNKYRAIDAYVGARMYWGRYWCDRAALFIGGKFGFVHHKSVNFTFQITPQNVPAQLALVSASEVPFTTGRTAPAGGANIGLDWQYGCGFSVVLMAEVVASCAPRTNGSIPLSNTCTQLPSIMPNALLLGSLGTELFFPITLGLKYSF